MKIIIIGAGISGLSTYLFLKKFLPSRSKSPAHDIKIYETYPSLRRKQRESVNANEGGASIIGGGLGLSPNGMSVIHDLDPELYHAVLAQGYPGTHAVAKSARGWTLGEVSFRKVGGVQEMIVWSSRQGIWDCFRDKVPDKDIICGKVLRRVSKKADGSLTAEFNDGTILAADLIIGADGVKSAVKRSVVGDGENDEYPPSYEGLVGVGGFMPSSYLQQPATDLKGEPVTSPFTLTFGAAGFFGYGPSDSPAGYKVPENVDLTSFVSPVGPTAMWWSTFESAEVPDIKAIDKEDIKRQLKARHGDWNDPVIRKLVEDVNIDLMLPTYTTPSLPTWSRDEVVLIGDAAHALPPTSGQGASQCLEDSYMFSLLLSHQLTTLYSHSSPSPSASAPTSESEAIKLAAKTYYALRQPRVNRILEFARKMGGRKKRMNVVEEYLTYLLLYVVFNFMPDFNGPFLYDYSVKDEVEKELRRQREAATKT
ncbi:MAG: hypothetical protein M1833_003931 [Piccolia ochrophora]|nr:MAG: hypothetical protein M1833_003931 [Piccolia ochrophora]